MLVYKERVACTAILVNEQKDAWLSVTCFKALSLGSMFSTDHGYLANK